MVEIFKALGDKNRLRIINLLRHEDLCVCELEVILNMTQSNVSRHLSKLKNAMLVSSSNSAQWVHYSIRKGFKEEHSKLYEYLEQCDQLFIDDLKRYQVYKNNFSGCQSIHDDKNKVLKLLEG